MSTITENAGSWVRRFHPTGRAAVRLVCFPHAGGAATFYFPVSRALTPAVDVVAIQYPGRQDRRNEACFDDIAALADTVAAELRPWRDLPLALFGHSMGATVAYEVGRRLESEGTVPLGLFASGRRAPSTRREESVHTRDDAGIISALKELAGTDSTVLGSEELLEMILPAVRGDYKAVETYRHVGEQVLSCPVSVLVGDGDPMTTIDEAHAWSGHTTGKCQVEVFSGGHFYLQSRAAEVLEVISRDIAQWSSGS